jgi:sulfoxide reductase catalytic subunit YedY
MLIGKPQSIPYSAVTPKKNYVNRRRFLLASAGLGTLGGAEATRIFSGSDRSVQGKKLVARKSAFSTSETLTPLEDVTHYNNFYEFGTDKTDPAENAKNFRTRPWSVSIEGAVAKPRVLDLDAVMKIAPLEERIYRHRCVEGWSMVVPWIGFSLNVLIRLANPTSKAKYVAFQSFYDSKQMPLARNAGIPFPYIEGLRMDEANHPLALLCFGLYGEVLPNQEVRRFAWSCPGNMGLRASNRL